jgi:hypothetical protein
MTPSGTGSLLLTDCSGVGVPELPGMPAEISLYPNPANDFIQVTGEGVASISVYDETGRLVLQQTGTRADISELAPGYYTVMAKDQESQLIGQSKLMKE